MPAPPLIDDSRPPALLEKYFGPDLRQRLDDFPVEKVRAYQCDAVAEQLDHVYRNNAFYLRKFDAAAVKPCDFRSLEDLSRFPFTTKDELRGDPWRLLSVPRQEVRLVHASTGTTGGAWSYILYTHEDLHVRDIAPRVHALFPVRPGDVVVNALPYEMSSSGQSFQRSLQEGNGAIIVPVGKGGFYSDPYKTVQIMAELSADVLITTPPYALLLSEVAEKQKLLPGTAINLRFMWLTGEGCSPSYRRRLQQRWHCPGLIFYGSMECGPIGIECPAQAGTHVCEGHVYLEVIDPLTGQPRRPGEVGEVVCTVLQRRAAPLIRFRTQDLGMLDTAPCSCGARTPRLHIRGRVADHISHDDTHKDGLAISPYLIEEMLYSQPEMGNNYQIYVDGAELLIEAEGGTGAGDAARDRILAKLRQHGIAASLRWVEHIPRVGGKTRRIRALSEREQIMNAPSLLQGAKS